MCEAAYLPFAPVSHAKTTLLLRFAVDLREAAKNNDGMARFLEALNGTILKVEQPHRAEKGASMEQADKKIILKFDVSYNEKVDIYAWSFNGFKDSDMIKYAKKYNFPRGCIVLWREGRSIDLRGFYPKFDNDKLIETGFDTRVLEGAESIDLFLKWSGFLLQICAFEVDGRYFFSVFSKQKTSHDSPFIQLGLSIAAKYMTPALVRRLADGRLYVGAECLSPSDDTHGYIVRQEALVVTCIGQGTFADLASGAQTSFAGRFVEYLPHQAIAAFCAEHGLACDDAVSVMGPPAVLSAFAASLFEGRDALTHGVLWQRLAAFRAAHPESVRVCAGAARHADVVGDTLEGVVLSIRRADGSAVTEKVKLPLYTWRTMMLREWLTAVVRAHRPPGPRPPSFACKVGAPGEAGAVGLGELRFVTADATVRMAAFCGRWCTSAEGCGRLTRLMKAAAVVLDGARGCGGRVALGGAEHTVVTPSLHVRVADHVEAFPADELDSAAAAFDRILAANSTGEANAASAEAPAEGRALGCRSSPPPGAHGRGGEPAERRGSRFGSCGLRGSRGSPVEPPTAAGAPPEGA